MNRTTLPRNGLRQTMARARARDRRIRRFRDFGSPIPDEAALQPEPVPDEIDLQPGPGEADPVELRSKDNPFHPESPEGRQFEDQAQDQKAARERAKRDRYNAKRKALRAAGLKPTR